MKRFFSSKLNVCLTILLIIVVGVAVWLGFSTFGNPFSKDVNAINFVGMSKIEVEKWVEENDLLDAYNSSYQYDETVEKDIVVYQSVKEGAVIGDKLTIVYSQGKDPNSTVDLGENLKDKTYKEAKEWFSQNEYSNVIYKFETNENIEFGKLISVTPISAAKTDTIEVVVSYGESIEEITTTVPNFATYTKDEIEAWGKEYAIDLDIKYETSQKVDENGFISQSVSEGQEIKGGESLVVVLSNGNKAATEKIDTQKEASTNKKTIPDSYIGLTESEFISKLKELGFTNLAKSSITYYAESLSKDTVYYYDDGTFDTSKAINYALCAGKWSFDANEFNGLTTETATTKVKDLQNRNAKINGSVISISFTDGAVNSDSTGKTYDCSINSSKISCKVYIKKGSDTTDDSTSTKATIPGNLLGTSEQDFVTKLKSLGFNNLSKSDISYYSTTLASGTIWSYDDGTFDTSKTINYALSAGAYSFNASEFNGFSTEEVNSKVKNLQNRNAASGNLKVSFKDGKSDNSNAGKIYDCSYSSSTISCYVYTSEKEETTMATIMSISNIQSWYNGSNFDEIKNKVQDYLNSQGFKNLTFNSVEADGNYVSEIYVGNQKHTSSTSYDINSNITVYIAVVKN